jgi:hypothetical protein
MRTERGLLRIGEYLIGRACRRLPEDIREDRYREWAAELPAILHDPQIRFASRRAAIMLGYAADTFRCAAVTHVRVRRQAPVMTAALSLLLAAYPISMLRRYTTRATTLIAISGAIVGAVVNVWDAAQAPADWVNDLAAALLVLLLLALWLTSRWARSRRA